MGRGFSGIFAIFLMITSLFLIPNTTIGQFEISSEQKVPIHFSFTWLVPISANYHRQDAAVIMVEEMRKIGINADLKFVTIETMAPRIWNNWEDPVPLYIDNESRGYDAFLVDWEHSYSNSYNNFGYLARPFSSFDEVLLNFTKDWGLDWGNLNLHNYYNESYVELINQYYQEFELSERLKIFNQAQKILNDDLPGIGIYSRYGTAIVNDNWDIQENEVIALNLQSKPSMVADLKIGTKENITIYTDSFRAFNPLSGEDFLSQFVFQPLYENDIDDPTIWVPLIAESLPIWNENRTEALIKIREDVFFADGHQLDGIDVKESFLWNLELLANPWRNEIGSQYYESTRYLNTSDSIEIIDPFTIKITLTEPYIFDMNLLSPEILPYHIYGSASNQSWVDIESIIFNDLFANSTSEYGLGTGPYTYGEITYDASSFYLSLDKNPNYWNGDVQTDKIIISKVNPKLLPEKISLGEIDLGFDNWADPTLTDGTHGGYNNLLIFKYDLPQAQWFGFNMIHPIYGTGVDTPLGLENPGDEVQAGRAARYIRKAINHALPRPILENQIYASDTLKFGPLPFGPNYLGFNTDLEAYEYNLTKSMEFMKLAGYKYSNNTLTTNGEFNESTSTDDSLSIQSNLLGLAMITMLSMKVRARYTERKYRSIRNISLQRELI